MSLDVYLTLEGAAIPQSMQPRIFVREQGRMRSITRAEWDARSPGHEPVTLCSASPTTDRVYTANITHNLARMAEAAGLYGVLWRPDELGITTAEELIAPLESGLARLEYTPVRFHEYAPSNGWGSYDGLVAFVTAYLAACRQWPQAQVSVWR